MLRKWTLSILFLSTFSFAVVSGDAPYEIMHDDKQEVIFSKEHTQSAKRFRTYSHKLHNKYEKSFGFTLSQKNYTTLASSQNQITNGYATMYPLLYNEFYSGGAASLDYFGANSWLDELTLHELSHTYQLDAKQDISRFLQTILGNNGLPIINPNYLLPTLLIEGNAVMNESRGGIGGRLFVGEHRALVYALSHDKKLNYTRLLNNHFYFPFKTEKYLVGGYFFSYLASKFGTKKANGFFLHHSTHYLNPLLLNQSFLEYFGYDFHTLIGGFIMDLDAKTKTMQYAKGKKLVSAPFMGRLNTTSKGVAVVYANKEGSDKLCVIDSATKKVTIKNSFLAIGKPFYEHNKWFTASQETIANNYIASGLYDEHRGLLPLTKDRHIMDIKGGKEVYFDIPSSFSSSKLFVDNQAFGAVQSEAVLDEEGNVYYAKQEGENRLLYRNYTKIGQFKGYWSKLMQVKNNALYFIGATPLGSSLFSVKNGVFKRVSAADNITGAQLLKDGTAIVKTVTGVGYELRKISLDFPKDEVPDLYHYDFKENTLFFQDKTQREDTAFVQKSQPYNPFLNLHFATFTPAVIVQGLVVNSAVKYAMQDPLHQNDLIVNYSSMLDDNNTKNNSSSYTLSYANRQYLLNYTLDAQYFDTSSQDYVLLSGLLSYNLWKTSFDTASIQTGVLADSRNFKKRLYGINKFHYGYGMYFGAGYEPYRKFAFDMGDKYTQKANSVSSTVSYGQAIVDGFYMNMKFDGRYSQDSSILTASSVLLPTSDPTTLSIKDTGVYFLTKHAYSGGLFIKSVYETQYYSNEFPLGVRRTALVGGATVYKLGNSLATLADMYELNGGLEFELLLAHLQVSRLTLFLNYNSFTQKTSTSVALGINY